MSNAIFPSPAALPGSAFPQLKTPIFSTIQQRAASLREVRVSLAAAPLYRYTLTYSVLRSSAAFLELQNIMDFYLARGGAFDNFLFDDRDDDAVTDWQFGTGDGVSASFQLARGIKTGGFAEPVANVNAVANVKDNGSVIPAGAGAGKYTINSTGLVTFGTVPTAGHALTWTGTYYVRCRFEADEADFNKFMTQLWDLQKVVLIGSLGVKV